MNALEPLQLIGRHHVRWRGRTLLYFSGCDYFRLASHPAVRRAVAVGLRQYGLNVAASRLTTGHHRLYGQLETALVRFFGAPAALVVPSGYVTSLMVAQALAGGFGHALLDDRAHAALRNAALHLGCPVTPFEHRNPADLRRAVARCGRRTRMIVLTDGMFSHDGSVAPLREYVQLLPRNVTLLVDDAHGAGVLGSRGRGSLELERVGRDRIVQCVTLSKAFGVFGGAILGSAALRAQIVERSRAFMGCTPLPLPLANAALQAVKVLGRGEKLRARLHQNAGAVKTALRAGGYELPDHPGPIISIRPRSAAHAQKLRDALLAAGIYPPFLRYGGDRQGCFRFVISSEHTPAQLSRLTHALVGVV